MRANSRTILHPAGGAMQPATGQLPSSGPVFASHFGRVSVPSAIGALEVEEVEEVEEVCSLPGPPVVSSFLHPNVFGFLAQNSATVRPSAQDMQSAVIALQQMGASPRVLPSAGLVVAAPP